MDSLPITICSDEKGYFDRECPNAGCLYTFKVLMKDWEEKVSDDEYKEERCIMDKPKEKRARNRSTNRIKLRFYFISLMPLFVLLAIKTIGLHLDKDVPENSNASILQHFTFYFVRFLPLLFGFLAIYGLFLSLRNKWEWSGVYNPPYSIETIKSQSFEYLTFLTTCIIPLCCFSFTTIQDIIVFSLLLTLIGFIFTRMDLYYGNPTLAIFKYRLYNVRIQGHDDLGDIIVISKDELEKGASIRWIPIDDRVWIAKKETQE